MLNFRLAAFRLLMSSSPRPPQIGHLAIAVISDEEYWGSELAGRKPTKRRYIAGLVRSLCQSGATVIALDFDLRAPLPGGKDFPDYESETSDLAKAISDSSEHCRIVLPATLNCPNPPDGKCTREPSVLDPYALAQSNAVTWGYINLPSDVRQIPLRRANVESGTLDSFSQAIAVADSPYVASRLTAPRRFPYGGFISDKTFEGSGAVLHSRDLLPAPAAALARLLRGKTVVVGGSWHQYAYQRGPMVDSHLSPVGTIPGVYLHANYAAAILDGRTYVAASSILSESLEALLVASIAVFFAVPIQWGRRWLWIGALGLGLIIASYLLWQNFGIFLEATIPAILLLGHALLDEYLKMREELASLRAEVRAIRGTAEG